MSIYIHFLIQQTKAQFSVFSYIILCNQATDSVDPITQYVSKFCCFFFQGKATSESVRKILEEFENSEIYKKIVQYITTPEGADLLQTFENTIKAHCGDYLEELKGIADGAKVDLKNV